MSYYILVRYYYYQNALGKPQDGLLRTEMGDLLEFESEQEAQEYIDNVLVEDVYILNHGEYARPTFEVVSPLSWGADCYEADGDELQPDYVPVAEGDVPDKIREILLAANVEYIRSEADYDVYAAYEGDYAIVYCPSAEALDYYADDLGNLTWSGYHFCRRD